MKPIDPVLTPGRFSDDAPVDELDEQLVAYLDGELEPLERDALEARLGQDESLRARLRQLQRGWDLLDILPGVEPSSDLLESTIRMAAVEAAGEVNSSSAADPLTKRRTRGVVLVSIATVAALLVGMFASRLWDRLRFRQQLRQLPVALRVEGYLQGTDLEWMRELAKLPAWNEAVTIAERLGEWDFRLAQQVDASPPDQRAELLRRLPIEDQQVVMEAWERFEKLEAAQRRAVLDTSAVVTREPDASELLATMERYARWRESLPADTRDKLSSGPLADRIETVNDELKRSVRQWTQQSARLLTDQDVETIYRALREIVDNRVQLATDEGARVPETLIRAYSRVDPRTEAFFIREVFRFYDPNAFRRGGVSPDGGRTSGSLGSNGIGPASLGNSADGPTSARAADPADLADQGDDPATRSPQSDRDRPERGSVEPGIPFPGTTGQRSGGPGSGGPGSDGPGSGGPGTNVLGGAQGGFGPGLGGGAGAAGGFGRGRFDFVAPALGPLFGLLVQVGGPLTDEELWFVESVLGDPVTDLLEAVAGIGTLREDLLRSWADESLRRMTWSRGGTTLAERYQLLDPARRDQLDLLKPDEILQWLRFDDGRRRSFP